MDVISPIRLRRTNHNSSGSSSQLLVFFVLWLCDASCLNAIVRLHLYVSFSTDGKGLRTFQALIERSCMRLFERP